MKILFYIFTLIAFIFLMDILLFGIRYDGIIARIREKISIIREKRAKRNGRI